MVSDWQQIADRVAHANGIPKEIFHRLISFESGWDPNATSPVGAKGFTQLMPKTAAGLGVNPDDPQQNLLGGARYLRQQFDRFKRWDLALAAYNAGPGAVQQHGGIPPFKETQRYVRGIMSGVKVPAVNIPASSFMLGGGPDLSSVGFQNLATNADPMEQLANLTSAVAAGGGSIGTDSPTSFGPSPGGISFSGKGLEGVDSTFLQQVSHAVAAVGGTQIRVTSARRHGEAGVPNSNHNYGHAIDAEVLIGDKWVPIGAALKSVAGKFGLRSGDAPGFYNGQPDPIHVDDGFNIKHRH